jgi:hypothetical protein
MAESKYFAPLTFENNDETTTQQFVLKVSWNDLDLPEFVDFCTSGLANKTLWTHHTHPDDDSGTDDCCLLLASATPPDHHQYQLQVLISLPNSGTCATDSSKVIQFKVSAVDCRAASAVMAGILTLARHSVVTTFQSFATQPRNPFPTVSSSSSSSTDDAEFPLQPNYWTIPSLKLHFFAVDASTLRHIFRTCRHVELRQCQVEGLYEALGGDNNNHNHHGQNNNPCCPEQLTLSCAMPEFAKFAGALRGENRALKDLELVLHFWLQQQQQQGNNSETSPVAEFVSSLADNIGLVRLSMSYLDMDDSTWAGLFESLKHHISLKTLSLQFTDNFVDNYRRLTAERRRSRTAAVLDMLQDNRVIQYISWPDFQQDELIMAEIKSCLARNRDLVMAERE